MSNTKTVMSQAANTLVKPPVNVEDVFSTYLYTGTGAAQTITNGIDLDGEGGLVWIKDRSTTEQHVLTDTERGATKFIKSNSTAEELTNAQALTSFNSNGFSIGNYADVNQNTDDFASWTFRKASGFCDVQTWTGDGVAGRTVSHNLGSVPGMVIVKRTDAVGSWVVYHRGLNGGTNPEEYYILLNTGAGEASATTIWNDTAPTASVLTLGSAAAVNNHSGATYVGYFFAHNDGDGEFGPDGDADIVKCGSYAGNSTDARTIDLGFEAQWVMVKRYDGTSDWHIFDSMRGLPVRGGSSSYLEANTSNAEATTGQFFGDNQGFMVDAGDFNSSGENYIYIAIRRGTKAPESATEVFAIDNQTASSAPFLTSDFPVDMAIRKKTTGSNSEVMSRLTQGKALFANATSSEQTDSVAQFDFNDGCLDNTGTDAARYGWMWKRAPGYFDVVAYTGNSTAGRTVSHNLGVAPEMVWVKRRSASAKWVVGSTAFPSGGNMVLNETGGIEAAGGTARIYYAGWDSSNFGIGQDTDVNASGNDYIAYLFASLPGISKVGSYTGNGSSQTIDCGFTSGARFVIVRDTTGGNWFVFDTDRGLTSSSSEALRLNLTSAEVSLSDAISPNSSGFIVEASYFNNSGDTYIFYAIA